MSAEPVAEPSAVTILGRSADDFDQLYPVRPGRVAPTNLFKSDGVRVIHLTFAVGQSLNEHRTPMPALLHVLSGRIIFDADGHRDELKSGAVVHMAAGTPHAVTALAESRLLIVLQPSSETG